MTRPPKNTYVKYDRAQRAAEDACPGVARMGIEYDVFVVIYGNQLRFGWRLLTADDFNSTSGARVTAADGTPFAQV